MTLQALTFTVYKIEADLLDVTGNGNAIQYLIGRVTVHGVSGGHLHSIASHSPTCDLPHLGDTYTATIGTPDEVTP